MHVTLYWFVESTTELYVSFVWQPLVLCKGRKGEARAWEECRRAVLDRVVTGGRSGIWVDFSGHSFCRWVEDSNFAINAKAIVDGCTGGVPRRVELYTRNFELSFILWMISPHARILGSVAGWVWHFEGCYSQLFVFERRTSGMVIICWRKGARWGTSAGMVRKFSMLKMQCS